MFDIGLSEILLVLVVGAVILKPGDMSWLISGCKKLYRYLRSWRKEFTSLMDEIEGHEVEEEQEGLVLKESDIKHGHVRMIKGNDGKWYESYYVGDHDSDVEMEDSNDKKT